MNPLRDDLRPRARTYLRGQPVVYLIHLHSPLAHARHYLGWTKNLRGRLWAHRHADASCFMAAVKRAGIRWSCVRVWSFGEPSDAYHFERAAKLAAQTARLCPRCRRAALRRARESMRRIRAAKKAISA